METHSVQTFSTPTTLQTDLSLLLRALNTRFSQAREAIDPGRLKQILGHPHLSEYTPRQTLRGLDKCVPACGRYAQTLFTRTVLQDHHYQREQMIANCEEIFEALAAENPVAVAQELPRVDFKRITTDEFFETYVQRPHPVVIENVGHDPSMYQLDALVARYGDDIVPMMRIDNGQNYDGPLSDLLEGKSYLANSDRLFVNHPELVDNLYSAKFTDYTRMTRISSQLFISNGGAGSPSHFGKIANTFYQLEGMKKWSLVDPAFLYLVYPLLLPGDAVTALHWQDETDHERCPLFRFCPRYETVLRPGDVLWNPYYWFHSVKNITKRSVAVADRWFGTPGKDFQSPLPLYDLATTLCPQSVDMDTYIQWMMIQQNITKKQIPWYEKVSHGRRYQAFDSAYNAAAWGLQPPDLSKGVFHHPD
ncbi:cupin-like domain-containing protein [Aquabacterium sp. A7-Y]|uniref:cupin-like domain-containing protein n=1 Tax=Aquabacterium sp. A7-Y TaxID=1349605 RepID=UPI00223DABDB|nr:cupin-like domain-containing protein [Aquabacterium sp. A7-Y]MCW7538514.1 cupin-like domain-containing protein [Aquabacterium sp. A7-Y]